MIECPTCRKESLNRDDYYSFFRCRICGLLIQYRRIEEVKRELKENGLFQMANPILAEAVYYPLLKEFFESLRLINWGGQQFFIINDRGKRTLNQLLIESKEELHKRIEELDNVFVIL